MTSDDIKSVQIIATTKDGKHIMAVSDEKPLIWHIASCCKFVKLKDELFVQCSLREIKEAYDVGGIDTMVDRLNSLYEELSERRL